MWLEAEGSTEPQKGFEQGKRVQCCIPETSFQPGVGRLEAGRPSRRPTVSLTLFLQQGDRLQAKPEMDTGGGEGGLQGWSKDWVVWPQPRPSISWKSISLDLRATSWVKSQSRWKKGKTGAQEGKGQACTWCDHMTTLGR